MRAEFRGVITIDNAGIQVINTATFTACDLQKEWILQENWNCGSPIKMADCQSIAIIFCLLTGICFCARSRQVCVCVGGGGDLKG